MRIAVIGCGYVADFYLKTLSLHPQLELLGVYDHDEKRLRAFSAYHRVSAYGSLGELLEDDRVELVLNLTNPRSHVSVSRACLQAGKHVYTEKPLAPSHREAQDLVALAEERDLLISSAPSRLLAETAQAMWRALRERAIGKVWLAYAEMDNGLLHRMPYRSWMSESGAPWPYKDEFETGCTIEHAAYSVTWLLAFFGPAVSVSAFSSCLVTDKETDVPLDGETPDFSVGCIKFQSGVVARITNSIVAPRDHSITIVGQDGILCTDDCWQPRAPVYIRKRISIRRKTLLTPWRTRVPLPRDARIPTRLRGFKKVDYLLGVVELAAAIREKRPCRLSHEFCLHVNEVVLAIHNALETGAPVRIHTTFAPIEPMTWAT